jgi:hypothetical protein
MAFDSRLLGGLSRSRAAGKGERRQLPVRSGTIEAHYGQAERRRASGQQDLQDGGAEAACCGGGDAE